MSVGIIPNVWCGASFAEDVMYNISWQAQCALCRLNSGGRSMESFGGAVWWS